MSINFLTQISEGVFRIRPGQDSPRRGRL